MAAHDPTPAIRAALVDADLIAADDPDLPAVCGRLRILAGRLPAESIAEHLDVVELLGRAGSDVITQAARQIVAAAQEERQ